jgi:predicted metallo-beta-lactamase superfamily hydrolase
MNYGNAASKIFSKDAKKIRLIDEKGLEWNCTVQNISQPCNHVRIGGAWGDMVRARSYTQGAHIMFGSPRLGNALELFVKKLSW